MTRRSVIPVLAALGVGLGSLLWYLNRDALTRTSSPPGTPPAPAVSAGPGGRTILYYRHPMGLPDTSPVPKRDAMGMDYVPVYAGEDASIVEVSPDRLQLLGVRSEAAHPRMLTRTLRIVGTIQPDERRQTTVSARFDGWVTRVLVGTTGAPIRRGDPLIEVYSPDLLSAEEDYRIAMRALRELDAGDAEARSSMERLARASVDRLRNWDIAEEDLAPLRAGEPPRREQLLRAKEAGVVTDKVARAGMRFTPGEPLYQVTDLSTVWLVADVFEQDLALVRVGMPVTASAVAYPGQSFRGRVSFVSAVLQPETRTAQVRVELPNPDGLLKPAMYGTVELSAGPGMPKLAIPDSAVLDTGTRQVVLLDRGQGRFEPRAVEIGMRADGFAEVRGGLVEGDAVVVNGNFLIDSESNLRAALDDFGSDEHEGTPGRGQAPEPARASHSGQGH